MSRRAWVPDQPRATACSFVFALACATGLVAFAVRAFSDATPIRPYEVKGLVLLLTLTAVFTYVGILFWRPAPLRQKLCGRCDYDLRGTADGSPCPECGAERKTWTPAGQA